MPPIPYNERYRLAALHAYRVLDTEAEPAFDRITRLAARHFRVPVALVSLVDSERQWFKSRFGLRQSQTSREEAFCAHAIMSHDVMQVPDATKDPRFADNPLVRQEPRIRFYAAAPLVSPEGFCLGTLCIVDYQPRDVLTTEEEATLRDLADLVMTELLFRTIRAGAAEVARQPCGEHDSHGMTVFDDPSAVEQDLAQKAQFDFLVSLAHELRTPLNAILGFSECMHKQLFGPVENGKYMEYSGYIYDSGKHLLGIANNILDLAKLRHGQISVQEEVVDVLDVMRQTIGMFVEQARRREIAVTSEPPADDIALIADRQQVVQMLVNLIRNSIKFTASGGSVCVTCRLDGNGMLILSVADTGMGIAPGDIDKALTEFGRIGDHLTREGKGTGLGLSITKRLIELHGGDLKIESRVGVGTRVDLRFPAYRVAPKAAGHNEAARTGTDSTAGPAA